MWNQNFAPSHRIIFNALNKWGHTYLMKGRIFLVYNVFAFIHIGILNSKWINKHLTQIFFFNFCNNAPLILNKKLLKNSSENEILWLSQLQSVERITCLKHKETFVSTNWLNTRIIRLIKKQIYIYGVSFRASYVSHLKI